VKLNRRFGGAYCLHLQDVDLLVTFFHAGILLGLFLFDPENGGDVSPKRRLIFNGLHGVISQKIVLFNPGINLRHFSDNAYKSASTKTEYVDFE
jgi:hypothetical protein